MRGLPWALASLVALSGAPRSLGAQETGVIQGTVFDERSQRPLAGAQVFLPNMGAGVVAQPSGRFVISGVPAGTHRLRTNLLGYAKTSFGLKVMAVNSL